MENKLEEMIDRYIMMLKSIASKLFQKYISVQKKNNR